MSCPTRSEEIRQRLLEELTHRATALWGSGRARVLAPSLAETAEALAQIAEHPPNREAEPDIFG